MVLKNALAVIDASELSTYQTDRGNVALSVRLVQQVICPQATDAEAYVFLEHCVRLQANPFLKEIYLIKYGSNPAQIVVGKDYFVKRAAQHPQYAGFHAGVIVVGKGGKITYREGAMVMPDEKLWGGWCDVVRRDWPKPLRMEALLSEYSSGQSNWKSKPATMMVKVPVSQAHRAAFPELFQTLYGAEELGVPLNGDGDPAAPYARVGPVEMAAGAGEDAPEYAETPATPPVDRRALFEAMKTAREHAGIEQEAFGVHIKAAYGKHPRELTDDEIIELTDWLREQLEAKYQAELAKLPNYAP